MTTEKQQPTVSALEALIEDYACSAPMFQTIEKAREFVAAARAEKAELVEALAEARAVLKPENNWVEIKDNLVDGFRDKLAALLSKHGGSHE